MDDLLVRRSANREGESAVSLESRFSLAFSAFRFRQPVKFAGSDSRRRFLPKKLEDFGNHPAGHPHLLDLGAGL
jgi:hypothetical protein